MRSASTQSGFTLIEVLVALAVVAITLAAGVKASGALGQSADRLQQMTAAQWCAENQLTDLRLTRQFPGIGSSDFSCDQLGRHFAGRLDVQGTPNPNFVRVDAVVSDDHGQRLLQISTVLGRN
ncbi:MAG: type II secretion system minor pseudopilin GspI [Burkholderiaceae bacterium]|nr:type II secretion system minor pseudopilin GspI [Roseateles sp.]MBV8469279.1 type II secretion system minor pseudopilin GspI [Burkholderiaceae bacterium]